MVSRGLLSKMGQRSLFPLWAGLCLLLLILMRSQQQGPSLAFSPLSPGVQPSLLEHPPAPPQKHVTIVVQECGRKDLVPLQYAAFQAFLEEAFSYKVVVCSSPESAFSSLNGTPDIEVIQCPEHELAKCYDFSYRKFVYDTKPSVGEYTMFANSDMFLWKRFSVSRYLSDRNVDVAAVVETHSGPPYIHPGLVLLNASKVAGRFPTDWHYGAGDVGGKTAEYLQMLATSGSDIRFYPMIWSRLFSFASLRNLRLIPLELYTLLETEKSACPSEQSCLTSDLYLDEFAIVHPRGSSNWQNEQGLMQRFSKIEQFIRGRIQGSQLTWSTEGATTVGEVALLGATYQHTVGNALAFQPFRREANSVSSTPAPLLSQNVPAAAPTLYPQVVQAAVRQSDLEWLSKLYAKADEVNATIVAPKIQSLQAAGSRLPLPSPDSGKKRVNQLLRPPRYDHGLYLKSRVYYWNYVYDGSSDNAVPDAKRDCKKRPGQRFWAATYAKGEKRERIAEEVTKPTCLAAGIDHVMIVRESDLDPVYRARNTAAFSHEHGVGMWIWKSYVQYLAMGRMQDGDILFYLDSDMGCSEHIMQYFCLAQHADVVPFHHSHEWYTMSRLVRRDAMVFMDMDRYEVAQSVQYSGGTIIMRKTPRSVEYVSTLAAWAQMYPVLCCYGAASVYSIDYPEYEESGRRHQCDQAISSLLIAKFEFKSYPWDLGGFGAGSDEDQNRAQRAEAGLDEHNLRVDMA